MEETVLRAMTERGNELLAEKLVELDVEYQVWREWMKESNYENPPELGSQELMLLAMNSMIAELKERNELNRLRDMEKAGKAREENE